MRRGAEENLSWYSMSLHNSFLGFLFFFFVQFIYIWVVLFAYVMLNLNMFELIVQMSINMLQVILKVELYTSA